MINNWQRNPLWKDVPLGTSKTTTIGSHGCTISVLGNLSGLTPDDVNERLKKVDGYANTNLVIWQKVGEAIPWLSFPDMGRHYSYDNDIVKAAIARNGGCLVEVDFDGTPRTDDRHWVLYVGNGKMYDPWTGTERPTHVYSDAKGFAILNVVGQPQGGSMPNTITIPTSERDMLVGKASKYDEFVSVGYDSALKLVERVTQLTNDASKCQKEKAQLEKKLSTLRDEVKTELKPQLDELTAIKKEVEDLSGRAVKSELDVFEALHEFHLEQEKVEKEMDKEIEAETAPVKAAEETSRELFRWGVFIAVPMIIQELLNNLTSLSLPPQTAMVVAIVLRAIDKSIHEYGKRSGAKVLGYDLAKGLTLGL